MPITAQTPKPMVGIFTPGATSMLLCADLDMVAIVR